MYILRRIGANLIDALLYIAVVLTTSWLCLRFNLVDAEFEVKFPLWSGFLTAILFPIIINSKTVGELFFRLKCAQTKGRSLRLGLILKYSVIYGCVTMTAISVFNFFGDLAAYYTIFSVQGFFCYGCMRL